MFFLAIGIFLVVWVAVFFTGRWMLLNWRSHDPAIQAAKWRAFLERPWPEPPPETDIAALENGYEVVWQRGDEKLFATTRPQSLAAASAAIRDVYKANETASSYGIYQAPIHIPPIVEQDWERRIADIREKYGTDAAVRAVEVRWQDELTTRRKDGGK